MCQKRRKHRQRTRSRHYGPKPGWIFPLSKSWPKAPLHPPLLSQRRHYKPNCAYMITYMASDTKPLLLPKPSPLLAISWPSHQSSAFPSCLVPNSSRRGSITWWPPVWLLVSHCSPSSVALKLVNIVNGAPLSEDPTRLAHPLQVQLQLRTTHRHRQLRESGSSSKSTWSTPCVRGIHSS